MAISRIPGYSLLPDLDRQGVDLQFTTNGNTLVYLDFANFKLGINETAPQEALHVVGNVLVTDSVLGLANLSQNLGSDTVWWNNIYSNTAVVTSISAGTLEGTLTTAAQPNVTSLGNLTLLNVDGLLTAGNITTGNISGTISTGNQPYISNLANVEVENLSIIGTLAISGNVVTEAVFAEEIYEANTRVLTANSNIQISGDATGYGTYNNVVITLSDTGVVAGVYGSGDDEFVDHVPKITVDSKGRITNIANVTLTQVGNVTFTDTTISTTSNITIAPQNGFIFANNSIVTDVADPVNAQDVVTLNYLNTQLGSAANNLFADDSILALWDDGVNPGYLELTLDGNVALNYSAALAQINSLAVNIGTLQFSGNTISSPGNITLDAQGSGIIQVSGADAFGLPYGNSAQRPSDPELGYFRYNLELSDIEWWNGNVWQTTQGGITSEVITPDGSNVAYTLTQNVTDENSVLVSINGTLQQPLESYTVSGNVITFAETPLTTDTIEVRIISGSLSTVVGVATQLLIGNSAVIPNGIDIEITGNLIPSANLVYSLGDNTHRWKDLYVSGNTIYIGDTTISASGSNLLIGGNPVAAVSTYGNANVAQYLQEYSGNISADYFNANVFTTKGTQGTGNISGVYGLSAMEVSTEILTIGQVTEKFTACLGAAGSYTISYGGIGGSSNSAHYWDSINSNVAISFIDIPLGNNLSHSFSIVINQGPTPYIANAASINGAAQTIKWLSGSTRVGIANNVNVQSFTIMRREGQWILLSSIDSYF